MLVVVALCSEFNCSIAALQEILKTRQGRERAATLLQNYRLYPYGLSLPHCRFHMFGLVQKPSGTPKPEAVTYPELPDIVLQACKPSGTIRTFSMGGVECIPFSGGLAG